MDTDGENNKENNSIFKRLGSNVIAKKQRQAPLALDKVEEFLSDVERTLLATYTNSLISEEESKTEDSKRIKAFIKGLKKIN